ncbi:MAG TPA: hypothetical protein VK742_03020 [Candidatus Sulfotelmatobacter sp.]|jgi:hypothetical protein|nr:hypothetical protein [Candidatus Sulfotelmatobacter sp.]
MQNRRFRPLIFAALALVAVWIVALIIFHFAAKTRVTAEKMENYAASVDLDQLSGDARAKAINDLADMANLLSFDERQKWRRDDLWRKWFAAMTEKEKLDFINKTLPTGIQQMLDAYSKLSDDQRKHIVDNSLKRMQQDGPNNADGGFDKNGAPQLSPELEQQVRDLGVQQLYLNSSAETKAELQPLLEQMQRQVQNNPR